MTSDPNQSQVANNAETTTKKLGGCTGKGFLPGKSGNPSGRPKKSLLTEMTAELLDEIAEDPEKRAAFKESIRQKLLAKGVVSAMTLDKLWERHEGKVVQPVLVDGELNLTLSERFSKAKQLKDKALNGEQ